MLLRENALAHNRRGHGHGQQFRQLQHFIRRPGAHGAAARVQDGIAGVDQQLGGLLHIGIGRPGLARRPHRRVRQYGFIRLGGQHILRHFQYHRAGRAGTQRRKSAPQHLRNILDARKSAAPLAQAVKDAGRHFLLPFLPQVAERMLPHQQQDGDVVGIAAGDGGQAVSSARPGAGHGDAHLAGGAGVAVGDFHAQPLVPRRKWSDAGRLAQRPPQRRQTAAGEPGYVTHPFLFQGFDHSFGATHNGPSSSLGWSGQLAEATA